MFKLVKIEDSVKVLTVTSASAVKESGAIADVKEGRALSASKQQVCVVRGQRVMLDSDAAAIYGIELAELKEQVKKNKMRFPGNYMFQLSDSEYNTLASQLASLKTAQRRKQPPHVFTERGVVMLSMVLGSYRALEMGFAVVDDFIRYGTGSSDIRPDGSISSLVMVLAGAANRTEKKFGFGTEGSGNIVQEAQPAAVYGQQH
jgi:hypothetical protein